MKKFFIFIIILIIILSLITLIPDKYFGDEEKDLIKDIEIEDPIVSYLNSYTTNGLILYSLTKYFPLLNVNYFITDKFDYFNMDKFIIDDDDFKLNGFDNKNDFDKFLTSGIIKEKKYNFFILNLLNTKEDCFIDYYKNESNMFYIINLKNHFRNKRIYFLNKNNLLQIPFYTNINNITPLSITTKLLIGYKSMDNFDLIYYFLKNRDEFYDNIYYYNKKEDKFINDLTNIINKEDYNYILSFIKLPNNNYEIVNLDFNEVIYECKIIILPENEELRKDNFKLFNISNKNIIKLYFRNKTIDNFIPSLIFFYSFKIEFKIKKIEI